MQFKINYFYKYSFFFMIIIKKFFLNKNSSNKKKKKRQFIYTSLFNITSNKLISFIKYILHIFFLKVLELIKNKLPNLNEMPKLT